jgi:hypothetical protein
MADGISALLKEVCVTPALPLARTIFEARLSLEYILKSDFSRRAKSWLAFCMLERMDDCNRLLGNKAASQLASSVTVEKKRCEDLLADAKFKDILSERDNSRKQTTRYPQWYSLFSGPENLRKLAKELGHESEYVTFYGNWSSISHVKDLGRFFARQSSNDPLARLLLRNPNDLMFNVAAMAAIVFPIITCRLVINKYRPGDAKLSQWYAREIKPPLDQLRSQSPIDWEPPMP